MFDLIDELKAFEPLHIENLGKFSAMGLNILLGVGLAACVLGIVYAAFLMATCQGDPDACKKALNSFYYSLIGLGLCFFAYSIKYAVLNVLGVVGTDLNQNVPGF